jgi:hypothetical protein
MRHARLFVSSVLVATALSALAASATAGAAAARSPAAQTRSAFTTLVADTKALPRTLASTKVRLRLLATARRANRSWRKNPCRTRSQLRAFTLQAKQVRKGRKLARREVAASLGRGKLEADLATVDAALLQLPLARRCGGAKASGVAEASATVLQSDERTLKLRMQLPAVQFVAHQAGGQDFLEPTMEGMGKGGNNGEPGLPAMTKFFGIPEGADVSVSVSNVESYTLKNVNLYPTQPEPKDQAPPSPKPPIDTFLEPPFQLSKTAYNSNKPFPPAPSEGGAIGAMRDIAVGGVDAAGGQYTPSSKSLKLFTSMDVTVNFGGDNKGTFGTSDLMSPWNNAFVDDYATLANIAAIRDRLRPIRPTFCGEELLIITSAELRPAANTLAAQRIAQGYVTSVREVGAGPGQIGTTPAQIQAFIRGRLNGGCLIHPSYVILFGNTAHVPTFLVPCGPGGNPAECNIASDLDYSLNGLGTDLFADVQLGRLPAPSLDSANALVAKLNTYATTSPAPPGDDFLHHAAVTSYFQPPLICVLNVSGSGTPNCDGESPGVNAHWEIDYPANTDTRGFTITAERIRNAIAADGYTVDRLYTTDDDKVIPTTYWNGTPIPSHLRRPAFPWNANTTDFLNAYNDGRFVILHRDHGWPDGWAEPTLHSGHVPGFTNGAQQPVVFGINCSSAAFDTPAHPSFVELQLLRPDGGAIAGFGDTRVSPSFPNNHMALGYFDAMFPSTVADYGGPETRRLGDIQIRGKQYMASQEGFEWHGAGETYVEHYLYHLLGDPTMQMWAAAPVRFDPERFRGIAKRIEEIKIPQPGDPPFFVHFELNSELALGTLVTVFRNGDEAIGRGIVGANGQVDIIPDVPFNQGDRLSMSLQQDRALPAQKDVENPKANTSMTQTCAASPQDDAKPMTTSGTLSPAFANADIKLTYTRPNNGGTFVRTVQTNANGAWSDTITPAQQSGQASPDGVWTIRSDYAGDATRAPSSAQCTVTVTNF